jgi:peptidyl-prolyl cis-trans isomerase SurA
MNKTPLLLAALAVSALALPPKDRVAAVVGEYTILASEVREAAGSLENNPALSHLTFAERCDRILNQMIDDKILLARAKRDTLVVNDADLTSEVESQLQQMETQFGGEESFRQNLQSHLGLQPSDMRMRILRQMRDDHIRTKVREKYVGRIQPTREEVESFYQEYKDSLPDLANQVKVSQIQLKLEAPASRDSTAHAEAIALIERLKKGESFEDLAAKWSQEPKADSTKGDIGYFKRGDLDPAYEKAAMALDAGQYTMAPVRSRFGWHVIQLIQKKDNEFRTRHILRLVQPDSLDAARIKNLADSLRVVSLGDTSKFAPLAQKYSSDHATAPFGGNLGWFPMDKLKDPFKSILEVIPDGGVSEPQLLGDSWYLFHIAARAKERKMNTTEDWIQLQNYTQTVLAQRRLEVYLKTWRKEISIERKLDGKAIANL